MPTLHRDWELPWLLRKRQTSLSLWLTTPKLPSTKDSNSPVRIARKPPPQTRQNRLCIDGSVEKLLAKDVAKERITQETADKVRSMLTPTTKLEDLSSSDFIIEAVPEIPDLKTSIFSKLVKIAPAHAILATNTSSISITRIAAATTEDPKDLSGPSRVISTHFMNPVPVQKGVEIITGLQTSQDTIDTSLELMKRMGKIAARSTDSPGFLANRILMPYINEAISCLENGIGTREDIDSIMKYGTNVPMGPLTLADFIGIDTCLAIMNVLHQETGDSKYRPAGLLKRMVDAGWVGKKAGKGFYDY